MVSKSKLSNFSRKTTRWPWSSWARSRRPCALWSRCTTTSCPSRTICASAFPSPTSKQPTHTSFNILIHTHTRTSSHSATAYYNWTWTCMMMMCCSPPLLESWPHFESPLKSSLLSWKNNWSRAYCVAAPLLWTKKGRKTKQKQKSKAKTNQY